MAVAHYNYYPPSGQVIDASDGRVTWHGRAWRLNGRVYGIPSTHSLVGKPGTSMAGWYYDWGKRAWMEPSAPKPSPPLRRPDPIPPTKKPAPPARGGTTVVAIDNTPKMATPIESLLKHPIAPVLGGVLVIASYLTDEPTPPPLSAALPEATQKQWQMTYAQNQQRFARRMTMFKDVGMVLLGYAGAQALLDVLPIAAQTMPAVATVDPDVRARSIAGRGAM